MQIGLAASSGRSYARRLDVSLGIFQSFHNKPRIIAVAVHQWYHEREQEIFTIFCVLPLVTV